MILMHKEGKLFSWIVGAENNNNVIILKGGLGILSLLTNQCTFINIGSKNWDFLSQTSSICNVWKSIWTCGTLMSRKQRWRSRRSWLRSIRSELENLPFNTAGVSIPLNWVCGAPLTTDPLQSELSFHHCTFLLCLTSGYKGSTDLKFGHVWHGDCINGMGAEQRQKMHRCLKRWTGMWMCCLLTRFSYNLNSKRLVEFFWFDAGLQKIGLASMFLASFCSISCGIKVI